MSILAILYCIYVIKSIITTRYLILESQHSFNNVWKSFFSNIRQTQLFQEQLTLYPIINILRKVLVVLVMVFLLEFPVAQNCTIFIINLLCSLIAIFKMQGPFHDTILNYQMSLQELLILFISGTHISYSYFYNQVFYNTEAHSPIEDLDQTNVVLKIQICELIELICTYIISILNLFSVGKFIKDNLSCTNQKLTEQNSSNNENLSTLGNNDKYFLLSQVDLNKNKVISLNQKQLKNNQNSIQDDERVGPSHEVKNKQTSFQNQQLLTREGQRNYEGITNKNNSNFKQDPFSFISLNQETFDESNKILNEDLMLRSQLAFTKQTFNNLSYNNIPDLNPNFDGLQSQLCINAEEQSTLMPQKIREDNKFFFLNNIQENNNTLNNDIKNNQLYFDQNLQNNLLSNIRQRLYYCHNSINYLENLVNNYTLTSENINHQLQDINLNNRIDEPITSNTYQKQQFNSEEDQQDYDALTEIQNFDSTPLIQDFSDYVSSDREENQNRLFLENNNQSFQLQSILYENQNATPNYFIQSKNSLNNYSSSDKKLIKFDTNNNSNNKYKEEGTISEFNQPFFNNNNNKNQDLNDPYIDPFIIHNYEYNESHIDIKHNQQQDNNPNQIQENYFTGVKEYAFTSSLLNYDVEDIKQKDIKNLQKKKQEQKVQRNEIKKNKK